MAELHGILVMDKPVGVPSAGFGRKVGHLLGRTKVGHLGTLDPFATGVLPLCLGDATKLSPFLLDGGRAYEATIALGRATDTYDLDGETTHEGTVPAEITREKLLELFRHFLGEIEQIPPAFSAKKIGGQPSYKLARRGQAVALPPQRVQIERIDLLEVALPHLRISMVCSKGTYVRSLAHDLGEMLGCGAHLSQLRRTHHGEFSIDRGVTWEQLMQAVDAGELTTFLATALYTPSEVLRNFEPVEILPDDLPHLRQGRDLNMGRFARLLTGREARGGYLKLLDPAGNLVALVQGRTTSEGLASPPYRYLRVFGA